MIQIRSIKGRLLLWIFLCMAPLFIFLGCILHQKFEQAVFESVDRTIHSKLQLVKGLMHENDDEIEFEVDEMVLGEYVVPRSGHYYQILVDNKVSVASVSLVDEQLSLTGGSLESFDEKRKEWIYATIGPAGEPLRVMRHDFNFLSRSVSIIVAESMTESFALIDEVSNSIFIIIPFMVILVGVVSYMIASFSLMPIKDFSSTIEKVTHRTLGERIETGQHAIELQGLADSFNSLLKRLQIAFESEKNFIADAAHELKTPLSVIGAQCDICTQKKRSSREYTDSFAEIKSVSKDMLRQINSMLTLARLDSGMLLTSSFKNISLTSCIVDAIRLLEPLAKEKSVKINMELGDEIIVFGDKNTLTEALVNIIENALRYNVHNGSIDIIVGSTADEANIAISDTGMGIRDDEQERIFDRFYRSEATRSTKGTGLGLSIAKAVMQAHNGEIKVNSLMSQGICVTLTLPLPDKRYE